MMAPTRRALLRQIGVTSTVGLAGCLRLTERGSEPEPATEQQTSSQQSITDLPEGTVSEGGGPDFDGYLQDATNYDGTVSDRRGRGTVTVVVGVGKAGGFGFDPPAVLVDNGATVVWVWSDEGGMHNIVAENGAFESDLLDEEGATFEHTFTQDGIYNYACEAHETLGQRGSVVVGDEFET